jgi:hypothetical protein
MNVVPFKITARDTRQVGDSDSIDKSLWHVPAPRQALLSLSFGNARSMIFRCEERT